MVLGSCHHDCPDTCVWEVTVEDGRAVRLRGSHEHPTTRGELCPKVNRFLDRVYHPDRVLQPLERVGGKGAGEFRPITWSEAIDTIASKLGELCHSDRAESILQFSFDGTQGVIQKGLMADRFFDALGASDIRRHLCGVTAWLGASDVSGLPFGIDPEELAHSRFIILWGTNTLLTNRHLWPVIEEARAAGATVVVVDPARTATAARADEFVQLRPGSDIALVLSMIHVIEREGLVDPVWISDHTSGWEELRRDASEMTPARAETLTGVNAEKIEWLARAFATTRPAAIRVLVGPEHRASGRDIMRAIALLPAVTGAWRDRGGGLARSTQVYFEEALNYPTDRSARREFNMAELGAVLTDHSLDPPIEALVVHNSNPAVIVPDQNRVIEGLERDGLFTVVIEQFVTDTARYADIVLPATTQIEHLDVGIAWGHLYLSLNNPAIEPLGEALPNTEIFRRLAAAMELDDPGLSASDEELIEEFLDTDHAWAERISLDVLRERGWARLAVPAGHRPNVDRPPDTADGRLQLGHLDAEVPSPSDSRYPLALLSPKQHTRFLNANYGGFEAHLPAGGVPTVRLHSTDADARDITGGATVAVHNERGRLTLAAEIDDNQLPGVVAVPFGWWHRHTTEQRGINALTNPSVPADGQGSAAFNDTWVEVEAVAEQLP